MRTNKYESEIMLSSVNKKMKEIEQEETLLQYVDDQMHETWDSAKAAMIGAQRLLLFHELPKEWQENEYVLSGYRFYQTSQACLKSIFMIHNETANIWSHLLGFLFMSWLCIYGFNTHFPNATWTDRTVLITFCVASLKCLFCSFVYHTFICHSHRQVKLFTATLDYMGIAFLITASVLVAEYYGFYCRPLMRNRYMMFTLLLGSVGMFAPFLKRWDTKQYRPLRIAVFVSMAVSSAVPVIHLFCLNGFKSSCEFFDLAGLSVLMYILGVVVYANRFPERMYPGEFDSIGLTSHAIWHVFVCFGIFFHYLATLRFYSNRHTYGCGILPGRDH